MFSFPSRNMPCTPAHVTRHFSTQKALNTLFDFGTPDCSHRFLASGDVNMLKSTLMSKIKAPFL